MQEYIKQTKLTSDRDEVKNQLLKQHTCARAIQPISHYIVYKSIHYITHIELSIRKTFGTKPTNIKIKNAVVNSLMKI